MDDEIPDPHADELWADPTVGHGELRRAFAIILRLRAGVLVIGAGWVLHMYLTMSPRLEPSAMWVAGLSGAVALLGVVTWLLLKNWPVLASLGLAGTTTAYAGLLMRFGILQWVAVALVAAGWICVLLSIRARLLLIADPAAGAAIRRFDFLTRGSGGRRMQRSFAGALVLAVGLVGWAGADQYRKGRVPVTLEPTVVAFTAAWNATADDRLRTILAAAGTDAWSELADELAEHGSAGRRPPIVGRKTTRAYDTRTTVVFALRATFALKTYWIRDDGDSDWKLDFLQIAG